MVELKTEATAVKLNYQESGMASIMTALIFMIVITLIVLGFAQISRREQSESLNRQLNTQAFYAAESGINDAYAAMQQYFGTPQFSQTVSKTDCAVPDNAYGSIYTNINAQIDVQNVNLTCLTVNPYPTNDFIDNIPTNGYIFPVDGLVEVSPGTYSSSEIRTLTFSWQPNPPATSYSNCGTANALVPVSDYRCPAPIVEVDIITRNDLTHPLSLYLIPNAGAAAMPTEMATPITLASFSPTSTLQGEKLTVPCNAGDTTLPNNPTEHPQPAACNYTIPFNVCRGTCGSDYYVRTAVLSKVSSASLYVSGTCGLTSVICNLGDDQVLVDSTADASGILSRIQARIPISFVSGSYAPLSVAANTSICKEYFTATNAAPNNNPINASQLSTANCSPP